ncbi:hypothetical protein M407DRAFT_133107 [Tulasnella calospora MUT 4182]|uniref:Uncharacterized protein n=1 Tax=Tulasnella calospora MUT 4182 TaxID=1051891 RepID=A0A0C3Q9W9_9AGAM|nr:hypothetical protein M407DRAFT_133107 [Tulasnella calospora MUT 4182]
MLSSVPYLCKGYGVFGGRIKIICISFYVQMREREKSKMTRESTRRKPQTDDENRDRESGSIAAIPPRQPQTSRFTALSLPTPSTKPKARGQTNLSRTITDEQLTFSLERAPSRPDITLPWGLSPLHMVGDVYNSHCPRAPRVFCNLPFRRKASPKTPSTVNVRRRS